MKKAKAFPKTLITIVLLLVTALIVYYHCMQHSTEDLVRWFESLGAFICRYDNLLIGIILGVNVIELIDYIACEKRDEVINASYELMKGHTGLFTMFKQYFATMFCKGPYIFATEESGSSVVRMLIGLLSGVVKYVYWLVVLLVSAGMTVNPDFYTAVLESDPDYAFTLFVLYACINCNVFVYALYRILPFYSTREYDLITYYSDGSSTRQRKVDSNFIALLFLSAIMYAYCSAYYILPFSGKLNRCIETLRFKGYLNQSSGNRCIMDYYRHR